jgi:hypothetical protein
VADRFGALAPVKFRVDTQADVTTVPANLAEREFIPLKKERPGIGRGIAGKIKKYRDRIRVVIAGREHSWPCDFTEPAIDPESHRPLPELPPVLGRAGFLDEYAISVDSYYLVITRLGALRRWQRRCLHRVWQALGMVHPINKPL